jgi:hypothetical protein
MKKPGIVAVSSVAVLVTAAAVAGAYSQRGLLEEFVNHQKEVVAPDMTALAALHEENSSISISPRKWMAPDATDIRLRFVTSDDPGWDVRYTTPTGLTLGLLKAGGCSVVRGHPKPALEVDWFPRTFPGIVYACSSDSRFVTQQGDTVYGWDAGPT